MANITERFPFRRERQGPATQVEPPPARVDDAVSPQDFYREMVERPDVQRVLTRLAQVTEHGA